MSQKKGILDKMDALCVLFSRLSLNDVDDFIPVDESFDDYVEVNNSERRYFEEQSSFEEEPCVVIYDAPHTYIRFARGIVKKENPWMTLAQIRNEIEKNWLYLPIKHKLHFLDNSGNKRTKLT